MTPPTHTLTARTTPLDKLRLEVPGWINPREFTGLSSESIGEMGESIKVKGIVEPPKVAQIQLAPNEIVDLVVDGQRRVLGARDVLTKSAPIPVVDLSPDPIIAVNGVLTPDQVDWLLIRAFTTLEREGLSSFELVQAATRWKKRGKTGEWIGNIIGRSASWVSKMLKARETASDKLLAQWRKGEVTDEQFKELAELKDPAKQEAATKEVVDARKSGDRTEARVRAKEFKEAERATNGHNKKGTKAPVIKPAVAGPQLTLDGKEETPPKADKPDRPKLTAPNKVVLQELVDVAAKRPPTADYVKGIVDGVKYALGMIEPGDFNKAWAQYVNRIHGAASGKKPKAKKPSGRTLAKGVMAAQNAKRVAKAKADKKRAKKAKKGRR